MKGMLGNLPAAGGPAVFTYVSVGWVGGRKPVLVIGRAAA